MRIDIIDASDERLRDFTDLTDVALRRVREPAEGLYLAESSKVIRRAISAGHRLRSLLLTEAWLDEFSDVLEAFPEIPIFVTDESVIEQTTGYHVHRGALASMHRPDPVPPEVLLHSAKTIVVLDGLSDHTNVGAIFRSVSALGADAVLLSPSCADPLYRRSVRVSMGAVLDIPWARLPRWQEAGPMLRDHGFAIAGFGLREDSVDLSDFMTNIPERLALVFGSEGPGLSRQAIGAADTMVRIRMDRGVDSLNVATAAGVALWAIRVARERTQ